MFTFRDKCELVQDRYRYDPETGRVWCHFEDGSRVVGTINGNYYRHGIRIGKKIHQFYLHQIGWYLTYGFWAPELDHIDRNGFNNKLENLRVATRSQNTANATKINKKCTSPYKGVWYKKNIGKWQSAIRVEGKRIHLGTFDNPLVAALVYDSHARELFGEFACTNFEDSE